MHLAGATSVKPADHSLDMCLWEHRQKNRNGSRILVKRTIGWVGMKLGFFKLKLTVGVGNLKIHVTKQGADVEIPDDGMEMSKHGV